MADSSSVSWQWVVSTMAMVIASLTSLLYRGTVGRISILEEKMETVLTENDCGECKEDWKKQLEDGHVLFGKIEKSLKQTNMALYIIADDNVRRARAHGEAESNDLIQLRDKLRNIVLFDQEG